MQEYANARARRVYTRALQTLCRELADELTDDDVRALVANHNTETAMFQLADGTGVCFVVHTAFGERLDAKETQRLAALAPVSAASLGALPPEVREVIRQTVKEELDRSERAEIIEAKPDRDRPVLAWCFNNIDEHDVTMSVLANGRVTIQCSELVEIPAPVVEELALYLYYGKTEVPDGAGPR